MHAYSCGFADISVAREVIEISSDSDDDLPPPRGRHKNRGGSTPNTLLKKEVVDLDIVPPPLSGKRKRRTLGKSSAVCTVFEAQPTLAGSPVVRPLKQTKASGSASSVLSHEVLCLSDDSDSDTALPDIRITSRKKVKKLVRLTEPPKCWTVPKPGESLAYLLDLSNHPLVWVTNRGEPMSMARIIKAEVSN